MVRAASLNDFCFSRIGPLDRLATYSISLQSQAFVIFVFAICIAMGLFVTLRQQEYFKVTKNIF